MQDIRTRTTLSFPYPIAASLRRLRLIKDSDYLELHTAYCDVFESLVKFLAIVALQDYRSNTQLPPYIRDFLRGLLHPSLGHWLQLLRLVTSEQLVSAPLASKVRTFVDSKISPEAKTSGELIKATLQSEQRLQSIGDILELLVTYRNKSWKGHGARVSNHEYQDRSKSIGILIDNLLGRLEFLEEFEVAYVDEASVLPTNEFRLRLKLCTGSQIEPSTQTSPTSLTPQRLYLRAGSPSQQFHGATKVSDRHQVLFSLHPLMTFYTCKECKSDQVFIFNDYHVNRLEFLSYGCGHFIYPDMLGNDFKHQFDMNLRSVGPPSRSEIESSTEAMERAEELQGAITAKLSNGHYFDALDSARQAVAIHPTSENNYLAAVACMLTRSSVVEGIYYLNSSLRFTPSFVPAKSLYEKVCRLIPNSNDLNSMVDRHKVELQSLAVQALETSTNNPQVRPFHFYITPSGFRQWSLQFWIIVGGIYFGTRAAIGIDPTVPHPESVLLLKFLLFSTLIGFYDVLAKSMQSVYFALLHQTSGHMREHFPMWFSEQISRTFGNFQEDGPILRRLNLSDLRNRQYFRLAIICIAIAVPGSVWLTSYKTNSSALIWRETLDYTFLWVVVAPGVPGVLRCFSMLREYSKLPLRPTIGTVSEYSLDKVGRMIFVVSIPWVACYTLFTMIGFLSFSDQVVFSQLGLFYLMVAMGLIWTLVTPLYLSKALSRSKERILASYGEHLDSAFKRFLESPTPETSERFNWLKTQQADLLTIRGNALSRWTQIGVLCLNIYVIVLAAAYPIVKFSDNFVEFRDAFTVKR